MGAPVIGSRWRHHSGNVYEYVGRDAAIEGPYCHALRLTQLAPKPAEYLPLGHRIHVELPWFERAAKEIKT